MLTIFLVTCSHERISKDYFVLFFLMFTQKQCNAMRGLLAFWAAHQGRGIEGLALGSRDKLGRRHVEGEKETDDCFRVHDYRRQQLGVYEYLITGRNQNLMEEYEPCLRCFCKQFINIYIWWKPTELQYVTDMTDIIHLSCFQKTDASRCQVSSLSQVDFVRK